MASTSTSRGVKEEGKETTTTPTTPERRNSSGSSGSGTASPTKKKVAPLIESRHEWIQEEVKTRKRQSIRDEDIPRSGSRGSLFEEPGTPNKADVSSRDLQAQAHGRGGAAAAAAGSMAKSTSAGSVQELASRFSSKEGIISPLQPSPEQQQRPPPPPFRNSEISMDVGRLKTGGEGEDDDDRDDDQFVPLALEKDPAARSTWMTSNLSMDISLESLDMVDRQYLGNARRHKHMPPVFDATLQRLGSDATIQVDNTTMPPEIGEVDTTRYPLARIQVADSQFLGFAQCGITEESQVMEFVAQLRLEHPNATHISHAYVIPPQSSDETTTTEATETIEGFDEDGEPINSTGPYLLEQIKDTREHSGEGVWLFPEEAGGAVGFDVVNSGLCVVIVRYFGQQLLGVTCGRLSQCYQRIAQLTLHRLFRGSHIPLQLDFTSTEDTTTTSTTLPGTPSGNIYGLAGGDTELHLDVVASASEDDNSKEVMMKTLLEQLNFDGFKGAEGEVLPRLQNLQATFYQYDAGTDAPIEAAPNTGTGTGTGSGTGSGTGTIIPIYRYPGNYHGDEWETFPWSSLSLDIKHKVENSLPNYYGEQKMNHCVTNFYRHGDDYIAHHSDKNLDLDPEGAIVSVSIGASRILELRRRAEPRDLTRLLLPHGSMLVLGPVTNQYFTHSILAVERDIIDEETNCKPHSPTTATATTTTTTTALDKNARISLTLRHVTTYKDTKTKRLFGQGVDIPTLQELRRAQRWDNLCFVLGFGAMQQLLRQERLLSSLMDAAALRWKITAGTTTNKNSSTTTTLQTVAQESVMVLGSAAVAWLSYARLRRLYLQRKEERAARRFFTRTSTSGTKY